MRIFMIAFLIAFLISCSEKEGSVTESTQGSQNVTSDYNADASHRSDNIHVSVEAQKVLTDLYGSLKWSDKKLVEFLKVDTGYITPAFEKKFISGGKEKLLVLGTISDTDEPIDVCHACTPVIGGAVFTKQGQNWVVDSEQKIIGWGGPYGTLGDIGIVQAGGDKYGISIRVSDMHQGYENVSVRVLVPYNGKLVEALNAGFPESPSEGACETGNYLPQSFDVKFEPDNNAEYFSLVTRSQFNEGDCQHHVRKDKTTRYKFHDGKYEPI